MHKNPPANQPLVSVVIPLYNTENYVKAAIESALIQTYPSIEIIVVDDGSTDHSAGKVRQLQKRHPSIKLIQQANQGVAAARNTGIEAAHGDYIAPLDADDITNQRWTITTQEIIDAATRIRITIITAPLAPSISCNGLNSFTSASPDMAETGFGSIDYDSVFT